MLEHGGTAPGSAPCRQASHVGSAGAGIADSGDAGTVHDGLRHCLPRHDWGGEINAMEDQSSVDQEFFVRYAQLAALSPMMQFSVLPSRVLDETHYRAVRNAVETREQMMPVILGLAGGVDPKWGAGHPSARLRGRLACGHHRPVHARFGLCGCTCA